ncbi:MULTISPECIES: TetR/AcrR family transcriptional regulator [unclassified Paenibacillus]|uniref:TetR/AcrR family transcriptional regulator n=1 Tax=unclassified Paenibacillus TaxID=185978 RepID=UPI0008B75563|nr:MULTISPECIES: TetR/AcrR family transcriptional regulator [unclassified Paenibacillus]QLG37713.1 TetR/AcrR family transcriptional regulator [Paenibacillus sp. E222]SEO47067.1 transcriptional regulator, TetR family [Paenibacillus sp. OK076]
MPNNGSLTSRGQNSRERILTQAAQLVYEKGVRGTSLDDMRVAASASKSQIYHYFANKEDLILAVIERQTVNVLGVQRPLLEHLDRWENLEKWINMIIESQESRECGGGCPLGSLASELADQDEAARVALVHSFDEWEQYFIDGFSKMKERGDLRAETDPAELACAIMTSLQGGQLLTKTRKSTRPIKIALQMAYAYVLSFATNPQDVEMAKKGRSQANP